MDIFLGHFFADCGASSGSMTGAILESKWANKRQHGPKKVLKSLTVPKSSNCKKCDFTAVKTYFSSLGGSQDEHKRLKTALKRYLKRFKTRKKVPNIDLTILFFGISFGTDLGARMDPEIGQKLAQKWNQIHVNLVFSVFDIYQKNTKKCVFTLGKQSRANQPVLFWSTFWTPKWVQQLLKMSLENGPIFG